MCLESTMRPMGDGLSSAGIELAGGRKTLILNDPLFNKSGSAVDKLPPKNYDSLSVDKIVATTAGTALHAASRSILAKLLIQPDQHTHFAAKLFPEATT